jgi:hypothetical protein
LRQHARDKKHTKARARIMKSAVERQNDNRIRATNRILAFVLALWRAWLLHFRRRPFA